MRNQEGDEELEVQATMQAKAHSPQHRQLTQKLRKRTDQEEKPMRPGISQGYHSWGGGGRRSGQMSTRDTRLPIFVLSLIQLSLLKAQGRRNDTHRTWQVILARYQPTFRTHHITPTEW